MSIVMALAERHTELDSTRGWIVVSEREWNAYWRSFGALHMYHHAARGGNTLSFRGCQLRVL